MSDPEAAEPPKDAGRTRRKEARANMTDQEKKATRDKRKELAEIRVRAKMVSEQIKSATAERTQLREKTQTLMSELGMDRRKGSGSGGKKGSGRKKQSGEGEA